MKKFLSSVIATLSVLVDVKSFFFHARLYTQPTRILDAIEKDEATSSYGTNGFAVTNLSLQATKAITITDKFALPVFAGITANPCAQKAYLVFGFTLEP